MSWLVDLLHGVGIERIGGKAGVDSKPGDGSRFWIELPKA